MARERISPAPCYRYVHDEMFADFKVPLVNRKVVGDRSHEQSLHPLLIADDDDPKGKYLHILISALFSIEHYDHWDTDYYAARVHAYLTQPIIEACLRIPTWVLTYSGVDRGLARKAFLSDLPRDVVRRFSKSTPDEFYRDIYKHNLAYLRDVLLDGVMVREQLLLRNKLEASATSRNPFSTSFTSSRLRLLRDRSLASRLDSAASYSNQRYRNRDVTCRRMQLLPEVK